MCKLEVSWRQRELGDVKVMGFVKCHSEDRLEEKVKVVRKVLCLRAAESWDILTNKR